jgi:hypothetical protein
LSYRGLLGGDSSAISPSVSIIVLATSGMYLQTRNHQNKTLSDSGLSSISMANHVNKSVFKYQPEYCLILMKDSFSPLIFQSGPIFLRCICY